MTDNDHGDEKKDTAISSLKAAVYTYCGASTIHGVSPIFAATNAFMRLFWVGIFLSSWSLLIWQLSTLVMKVRGYEVILTTKKVTMDEMRFPAVMICNANPYSKSRSSNVFRTNMMSTASIPNIDAIVYSALSELTTQELFQTVVDPYQFTLWHLNLSTFAGANFPLHYHQISPLLGSCSLLIEELYQKQVGPEFGFSMILNINETDYSPLFRDGYGVLIQIVDRSSFIEHTGLKNNGIAAAPGREIRIKMKKKKIIRLPSPYPDEYVKDQMVTEIAKVYLKSPWPYSVSLCRLLYLLRWQMHSCGYVDSRFKEGLHTFLYVKKSNLSFNNATKYVEVEKEFNCIKQAEISSNAKHHCKPCCDDVEYEIDVSSLKWPTKEHATELLQRMKEKWPKTSHVQNWTTDNIYRNLVKVTIYFTDFQMEVVEQKPAYDWSAFLSDFGGQAGLWIGASVYSAFELCSLMINLFYCFVRFLGRKKKVATIQDCPD